jgi:hypothetical protein
MGPKASTYQWIIGKVSESEEHIKISFGSYNDTDGDKFILVARVSKPKENIFVRMGTLLSCKLIR